MGHFYSHWQHNTIFHCRRDSHQNVARVVRNRFCHRNAGAMLQSIYRIELFPTCCKYWGNLATSATAFDFCRRTAFKMSRKNVKLPVAVEIHRCNRRFSNILLKQQEQQIIVKQSCINLWPFVHPIHQMFFNVHSVF